MTKEVSLIVLDRLKDAPYLDRCSGLVQTFELPIEADGKTIKKKIPVTSFADFQDCENQTDVVAMIPDSRYKSLLYFEDNGTTTTGITRAGINYVSKLRLVCWLNTVKISGQADMLLTAQIISDMIDRLSGNPFNSPPFTRIVVKLAGIPQQDKRIFSRYDYNESETQFLMNPFEFFALDLQVSYTICTVKFNP